LHTSQSEYLSHQPRLTLEEGLEEARQALEALAGLGIDLNEVTATLEEAGVAAFADDYTALLEAVEQARREAV